MNPFKYILILFLSFLSFYTFAQDDLIKMDTKETPLAKVIEHLENNHSFLFSYKGSDIQNIKVTPPNKASTIIFFLETILKSTDLDFEIVQKKYVILSKKDKASDDIDSSKELSQILCGKIIDQFSNEPIEAANVYFPQTQKGTSTAEDGTFSFPSNADKKDSLVVSYVGFQEKKIAVKDLLKKPCPTIGLEYYKFSDNLIIVKDYLTDGIDLNGNGTFAKIKPSRIQALPGQAEPDVLKTIQFLPGISSPDQTASGIFIRGGTPDQNLILWEDIPIYHSAHYFGTVSAFNPHIIDEAKVYRGGFNADYGGRISGVIDLKTNNNTHTKNDFVVGANLLNAYANGRIINKKKKASVVFSLRRSIADVWRSPTLNDLTQRINQAVLYQLPNVDRPYPDIRFNNNITFFDSNVKSIFNISKKDKISVAFFYGKNDFESLINDDLAMRLQRDTLNLFNRGASASWNRVWNSKFNTKLSVIHSKYKYEYDYSLQTLNQMEPDKFGKKTSKIIEQQIHLSSSYKFSFNHTLKTGYHLTDYDVGFQITRVAQNNNQTNQNQNNTSLLHVLYGTWDTNQEKKLGAKIGVRGSYYEAEKRTFFEPRLQLSYKLSDHFNIYLNTGKYFQFLSQLIEIEGDQASIETPVWALTGKEEVPILDAVQHQVGFLFRKNNWIVDVQAYYKNVKGMTSLASGFVDEDLTNTFHIGEANIKGLDILLKKRVKNFRSWISYSLGKIDHKFPTFFDANFASPNDQRHVFNWVNMMKWKNWEFSLGWKYTSGTPYSLRENYTVRVDQLMNGPRSVIEPLVNEFNSENLSPFHHLDASILYTHLAKNKKWKGVFGLSFYNIYNKRNSYNRTFFIDNQIGGQPRLTYADKIDVGFMPNFVMRFEF